MENKNHWYDGTFYDRVIAPHQDRVFAHARRIITDGATVLDVGCGTGRLVLQLAEQGIRADGIDPSKRNIEVALKNLTGPLSERARFHHADAMGFLMSVDTRFDFATISYVIHEVDEGERTPLLQALASSAGKVIMIDYLVPQPKRYSAVLNEVVEYVAGRRHYRNFKSFVAGHGLPGLVERAGLRIESEVMNNPPSSHIVVATR